MNVPQPVDGISIVRSAYYNFLDSASLEAFPVND